MSALAVLPASFQSRVAVTDDCWEWTGYVHKSGYGMYSQWINGERQTELAHRFCYRTLRGPISLELNHLCYNRACVNPDHLEDVTHSENVLYSVPRRATFTHCKQGHSYDDNCVPRTDGYRECRICRNARTREKQYCPAGCRHYLTDMEGHLVRKHPGWSPAA